MNTTGTHTYILEIPGFFSELISFNSWFQTRSINWIENQTELEHMNTYYLKLDDSYYTVNEKYYHAIKKVVFSMMLLEEAKETILDNKGE